ETPLVYTKYKDVNLGVVRNLDDIKLPADYEKTTVKLEEQDIEAFKNEKLNITIAYLVNESGEKSFYIIDENKVQQKYETVTIGGKLYVILDRIKSEQTSLLKESTVKIGDIELNGWIFDNENQANYSIVYLINEKGEKGLYTYEGTEGTLQKYVASNTSSNSTLTYVLIGTTAVFAITTGVAVAMYFNFKKKSISAIKDYYDSKNQGE
ncbi:MAG: oxidoreductase, partial [Coprobacillus sp.]